MPTVERENQPLHLESWAITRWQFVELLATIEEVVGKETEAAVDVAISVPGYERDFEGIGEFADHVDDSEWTRLGTISVRWASGEVGHRLRPGLEIRTWEGPLGGVSVQVRGANRRARNAIEPDVHEAVRAFARRSVSRRKAFAALAIPVYFAVNAAGLAALFGVTAAGASDSIAIAVYAGLLIAAWPVFVSRATDWVRVNSPRVELLAEDGVPRWHRAQFETGRRVRTAGWAITLLITVVGFGLQLMDAR